MIHIPKDLSLGSGLGSDLSSGPDYGPNTKKASC